MTQVPPDIQRILDEIDAADRAAEALVAGLSDAQLHWQPDGGKRWSIAQCLQHLARINVLYGDAIRGAVAAARERGWTRRGPLAPGLFGRLFIRQQEPPVRVRMRAPGNVQPSSGVPRDEIMRQFREAHDRVRQTAREAALVDANRATFPNPFIELVRVRVATGLHVLTAHDRRHLWQAGQVKARADFPSGDLAATGG